MNNFMSLGMKKVTTFFLITVMSTIMSIGVVADFVETDEIGGLESLRTFNISEEAKAEPVKKTVQNKRYDVEFFDMPPLIPHSVDRSQTDLNANTCLQCHSAKNASKWGATRIAVSHYNNRDGEQQADISPDRYFCLACHVPQTDGEPLKENTFKPVDSLKR